MCMVLAIRTHILSEQAHVYQSLARQNQFNTRLHNRQRMVSSTPTPRRTPRAAT